MADTVKTKKNHGIYIIIAAFVIMTIVTLSTGTIKVKWSDSLEQSFKIAAGNKKPLFIVFLTKAGEDASVSKRLEFETLTSPEMAKYLNDNFNPVRLDRDSNVSIAVKYGVKKLPAMVLVTADDKENIRLEGYISENEFMARVGGAMKQLKLKADGANKSD